MKIGKTRPQNAAANRVFQWAQWVTAVALFLFTLRRWLFLLAAPFLTTKDAAGEEADVWPGILLLVPFFNEAAALPDLLAHLVGLDYPVEQLAIVLINDGSRDASIEIARRWTGQQARRYLLDLPQNGGKAAALNAALAQFPHGELIAVFDADERPCPDVLRQLVSGLADERVGAVNGRRAVSNPLSSYTASYAAIENLVHEQITMRGKARLGLAPALLGSNCIYRRAALEDVGGFRPGALLEDTEITLRLAQAGWQTRYLETAVSYHAVPHTLSGYWQQRLRWSRGFQDAARRHATDILRDGRLPYFLRLELIMFSLGYLDRIFLLLGLVLVFVMRDACGVRRIGYWVLGKSPAPLPACSSSPHPLPSHSLTFSLVASLLTPLFQVVEALWLSRAPLALWRRIILLPPFLGLDVLTVLFSLGRGVVSRKVSLFLSE